MRLKVLFEDRPVFDTEKGGRYGHIMGTGTQYIAINKEDYHHGQTAVVVGMSRSEDGREMVTMCFDQSKKPKEPGHSQFELIRQPIKDTEFFTGDHVRVLQDFGKWKTGDEGMLPFYNQVTFLSSHDTDKLPEFYQGRKVAGFRTIACLNPWKILPGDKLGGSEDIPVQFIEPTLDQSEDRIKAFRQNMIDWSTEAGKHYHQSYWLGEFDKWFKKA